MIFDVIRILFCMFASHIRPVIPSSCCIWGRIWWHVKATSTTTISSKCCIQTSSGKGPTPHHALSFCISHMSSSMIKWSCRVSNTLLSLAVCAAPWERLLRHFRLKCSICFHDLRAFSISVSIRTSTSFVAYHATLCLLEVAVDDSEAMESCSHVVDCHVTRQGVANLFDWSFVTRAWLSRTCLKSSGPSKRENICDRLWP